MKTLLLAGALVVGLSACNGTGSLTPHPHAQTPATAGYANSKITPGATNPNVTQATIGRTICVRGYTGTIRPPSSYTQSLEPAMIRAYGYRDRDGRSYTMDHLIPLEIGGAPRDPRNLFPQPRGAAKTKDRLENSLHAAVCSGRLTLVEAQRQMLANWVR